MSIDINQYLRDGCTVVTGNNRLARHLELEFSKAELAAGRTAWRTPDVLPWSLWIPRVWQEARISSGAAEVIAAQRLLSSNQAALVWEQVIEDLLEKYPTANPPALARLASRSWKLLHQWQVAPADMRSAAYSPDQKAFVAWSNSFRKRCEQEGWLTADELPSHITALLSKGLINFSAPIRFVGFDDFNPQENTLLQALVGADVDAQLVAAPNLLERCERVSFADEEQELAAAAHWAKERLQNSPGESVAVLIPDLEQRAAHVRRVFMDCLMPDWRSTGGKFLPPVNLSLGQPLVEKGMISTALRLLGLPWRAMPFADISLLLRSPYVAGFDIEQMERATAELELRGQGIVEIRAASLAYRTRETAPVFSKLLTAVPKWSGSARASVWAERFAGLLNSCGWPGDQSPQSSEYRAFTKWQKLLEELAGFDSVLGDISVGRAQRVLRSLAAGTLFQAEGNPDGVQVMGLLEASGQQFDHLWLGGLTTDVWPQSAQPDSLIPFTLQRNLSMPNSTPLVTHAFASKVMQATLNSSMRPVVSWPRFRDEEELHAAPLPVASIDDIAPSLHDDKTYAEAIYASRNIDVLNGDDDIPPPVAMGQKVYGGSGLLAQQAACPARAFVERRLGARELRQAVSGLDPMVRGELMHKVLELWYQKYPQSSSLKSMGDDERAANLTSVIQQLFEPRLAAEQGVLAIVNQQEALRLQVVVEKFFGLELQREPFTVVQTEEPAEVEIFGLELSLKLDRVDRLSNGDLLVIDYKSSKITHSRWAPPRPTEAQLPLYAVTGNAQGIAIATVSSKEIRIDGWSDSETGLKNIKPIEKLKFDVDSWDDLIEAWRESFDILAQEFLAGDFRVNLHDPKLAQGEFGLVIRSSELPVVDDEDTDGEFSYD